MPRNERVIPPRHLAIDRVPDTTHGHLVIRGDRAIKSVVHVVTGDNHRPAAPVLVLSLNAGGHRAVVPRDIVPPPRNRVVVRVESRVFEIRMHNHGLAVRMPHASHSGYSPLVRSAPHEQYRAPNTSAHHGRCDSGAAIDPTVTPNARWRPSPRADFSALVR